MRYRNIWIRELGNPGRREFSLPNSLLESYTGTYSGGNPIEVTLESGQLVARMGGVRFLMFAGSPTRFFAKTTDFQIEFHSNGQSRVDGLTYSVGEGANEAKKTR